MNQTDQQTTKQHPLIDDLPVNEDNAAVVSGGRAGDKLNGKTINYSGLE
jgi:hypothetical protein